MKVLIVDDEALVRRSLKRAFESRGYSVIEAADGRLGLEAWLQEKPDVIFLDVLMPRLSGPQVMREIGGRKTGVVVLMSAYSGEDNDKMARQLGANCFMAKPFEDIFTLVDLAEKLYSENSRGEEA